MSEERHPVHVIIADLTRPESVASLEESMGPGPLRDRVRAFGATGIRFVAILVGSGVAIIPLPTLKDLMGLQRVFIDLALNLGIVEPVPLELGLETHDLLIDELDAQALSTSEIAGHA